MSNELQKHKTGDKIKWILTLLAFILVGVMFAGIILGWFDKETENKEETEEQAVILNENGEAVNSGTVFA
ncbi:MAG: hypothetical protein ACI4MC_04330, partial [Candidatus Coproplasma sp.]